MCSALHRSSCVTSFPQILYSLISHLQWGVIGPQRLFSRGQMYYGLVFFFLFGAIFPLIQWILQRKFKSVFLKYLNFPLIFMGLSTMPPATPLNFVPWVVLCFIFNYVIRRRHFGWWAKYNCASAIFDSLIIP